MKSMHGWIARAARVMGSVAAMTLLAAPMIVTPATRAATFDDGKDMILFRNGNRVEGKIISETATKVRIRVMRGTIAAETEYNMVDVLRIERAADPAPATPAKPGDKPAEAPRPVLAAGQTPEDPNDKKVYVIELKGWFGEDISQTPIRDAMKDARKNGADYVIVIMDNDWSLKRFRQMGDIPEDVGQFDQLWRTEDMDEIFTAEVEHEWDKKPEIVFWVKKAMGGAAFLPLVCPTIYFSSDAKMGGVGDLAKMFGGTGDEVVREKQYSLRIGHAIGIAATGGYAPEIVRAMARHEYVLSVSFEGGKPVFHEDRTGETLLTDTGVNEEEDTDAEAARGGNDVLTLDANWAYKLGVSKGTVDTLDDLLFELGIARNHTIVKGKAAQVMESWSKGVADAKRALPKLWQEFNEIPVQGEWAERRQGRSRKLAKIDEILSVIRRYKEAINPQRLGLPDEGTLNTIKEQIKLEQMSDKR